MSKFDKIKKAMEEGKEKLEAKAAEKMSDPETMKKVAEAAEKVENAKESAKATAKKWLGKFGK